MVALTIDLGGIAQGLQGTLGKLNVSLTFSPGATAENTASGPALDGDNLDSTLRIAGLPLTVIPLEEAARAHAAVEGGAVGKVLLDVGSGA